MRVASTNFAGNRRIKSAASVLFGKNVTGGVLESQSTTIPTGQTSSENFLLKLGRTIKSTLQEMYGTVEGAGWKRNTAAAVIVGATELFNYLIPAFSQASQSGHAKEVKKGEGARGIIIGVLDGAAVGVITAKAGDLTAKRVATFATLGIIINYLFSKILPVVGEAAGKVVYYRNKAKNNAVQKLEKTPETVKPAKTEGPEVTFRTFLNMPYKKSINQTSFNTIV